MVMWYKNGKFHSWPYKEGVLISRVLSVAKYEKIVKIGQVSPLLYPDFSFKAFLFQDEQARDNTSSAMKKQIW